MYMRGIGLIHFIAKLDYVLIYNIIGLMGPIGLLFDPEFRSKHLQLVQHEKLNK